MTEYLQGRQAIYEYLYIAYYRIPDAELALISRKFLPVFETLGEEVSDEIALGGRIISDCFKKNADLTDDELAIELNVSFTKFFNMADSSVHLIENQWRREEKSKEDIIISISNYFADAGAVKPTVINMPIDSYSMELYYLYHTSRAAAKSEGDEQDKILAAQFAFMKDHILCWTDMFTSAVIKKAGDADFYSGLAHLSNGFLKYDFSFLEDACEQ